MEHGLTVLNDEIEAIGCSSPPRSSAANQWTERTGSNDYEAACACVL